MSGLRVFAYTPGGIGRAVQTRGGASKGKFRSLILFFPVGGAIKAN